MKQLNDPATPDPCEVVMLIPNRCISRIGEPLRCAQSLKIFSNLKLPRLSTTPCCLEDANSASKCTQAAAFTPDLANPLMHSTPEEVPNTPRTKRTVVDVYCQGEEYPSFVIIHRPAAFRR